MRIGTISGLGAIMLSLGGIVAAADAPALRYTPQEVAALPSHEAGAGTSGVAGIRTTALLGDPAQPGLYTIRIVIPPNTKIAAHTHKGTRSVVVTEGEWYFGIGPKAEPGALKQLVAGSFYTEPDGVAHFAETRMRGAVLFLTGVGPTDTVYVDRSQTPEAKPASGTTR